MPFVLAGIGLAAAIEMKWERKEILSLSAVGATWIAVFAVLYLGLYRPVAQSPYMQTFWEGTFLTPGAADFRNRVRWAAKTILMVPLPGAEEAVTIKGFAVLFAWGLWWIGRERGLAYTVALTAPFVAVTGAGALHLYPIAERLVAFLVPLLFLVYGYGLWKVAALVGKPRHAVLALICVLITWVGVVELGSSGLMKASRWNTRTLIGRLQDEPAVDPVYVYTGAIPAWIFYTTDWKAPDRLRLVRIAKLAGSNGPAFQNSPARGRPVKCEGDGLEEQLAGRRVLLGVSAGVQSRAPIGWSQAHPDSGWAANEARRIVGLHSQRVWILAAHYKDWWIDELLTAVEATGGVVEERHRAEAAAYGASLHSVRFSVTSNSEAWPSVCPGMEKTP